MTVEAIPFRMMFGEVTKVVDLEHPTLPALRVKLVERDLDLIDRVSEVTLSLIQTEANGDLADPITKLRAMYRVIVRETLQRCEGEILAKDEESGMVRLGPVDEDRVRRHFAGATEQSIGMVLNMLLTGMVPDPKPNAEDR